VAKIRRAMDGLRLPSGREVTLEHGQRVLAEAMRDATESGATREEVAAKLGAVFDETTPFSKEDYEALLKRAREAGATYRAQFAEREQQTGSKLTPTHTTFASLRASGRTAKVYVLEPDHNRCSMLLEHLFAIGGVRGKPMIGADRLCVGPVAVWVVRDPKATMGWPRDADIVVGFEAHDACRLIPGPGRAVSREDAPRFWSLDQPL
jgi:hypothetical protein